MMLHVALQNSGLLVQKKNNEYIFETFEASPQSADVLAAQGALQRQFPSRAVAIPSHVFEDELFQETLAEFLQKASLEPVKQYAATTLKAGSQAYESRDTSSPAIIGQLLITMLEAVGRKHPSMLTRKRVRDEVCWGDGAETPWRRSATWLVLRVGIQRTLCSLLGPHGAIHYKFFMCYLHSTLCHKLATEPSSPTPADRLAFARTKLARRIAKMEEQNVPCSSEASAVFQALFNRNEARFMSVLRLLQKTLDDRGSQLRNRHTKKIYRLPKRADPESTVLSLYHSRGILDRILTEVYSGQPRAQINLPQSQSGAKRYYTWVNAQHNEYLSPVDCYCLAEFETRLVGEVRNALESDRINNEHAILELQRQLRIYQSRACKAYKENAEQLSLMLLTLMEVWMAVDLLTVRLFPLLVDYDPGFPRDLMHPLKVPKLSDMHRLQHIENYLEQRRNQASFPLSDFLAKRQRRLLLYDTSINAKRCRSYPLLSCKPMSRQKWRKNGNWLNGARFTRES